jgi:hypothetical protein
VRVFFERQTQVAQVASVAWTTVWRDLLLSPKSDTRLILLSEESRASSPPCKLQYIRAKSIVCQKRENATGGPQYRVARIRETIYQNSFSAPSRLTFAVYLPRTTSEINLSAKLFRIGSSHKSKNARFQPFLILNKQSFSNFEPSTFNLTCCNYRGHIVTTLTRRATF